MKTIIGNEIVYYYSQRAEPDVGIEAGICIEAVIDESGTDIIDELSRDDLEILAQEVLDNDSRDI